jgi:hypothetical protein
MSSPCPPATIIRGFSRWTPRPAALGMQRSMASEVRLGGGWVWCVPAAADVSQHNLHGQLKEIRCVHDNNHINNRMETIARSTKGSNIIFRHIQGIVQCPEVDKRQKK